MVSRVDRNSWLVNLGALLVPLLVALQLVSSAPAQVSCGYTALTGPGGLLNSGRTVALSGAGDRVLMLGRLSPVGEQRLFEIDLGSRQPVARAVTGPLNPELLALGVSASDDLGRLVFRSRVNLGANEDGSIELFLLNLDEQRLEQLTEQTRTRSVFSTAISSNGGSIAFISNGDPAGRNADGSRELFHLDLGTGVLIQVTDLTQLSAPGQFSLSGDGQKLAYEVRHTFSGFAELNVFDRQNQTAKVMLTSSRFHALALSEEGDRVAVLTDVDLVGENLDGGLEVFQFPLEEGAPQPIHQLSNISLDPNSIDSVTFSRDARRFSFRTSSNLLRWDSRGTPDVYLYDLTTSQLSQVTFQAGRPAGSAGLLVNRSGDRLVASADSDLSGRGVDTGNNSFWISCEEAKVRFVPQVGFGVSANLRLTTGLVLTNTGPTNSIQIEFFDQSGQALEVDLGEYGRSRWFNLPIKSGTPLLLETRSDQPLRVGYARIVSSAGVQGNAVFTGLTAQSDGTLYEAAVPLSETLTDFSLVVDTRGTFQTGLALVNAVPLLRWPAGGELAPILLRLYDEDGELVAEKELLLSPGRHTAQFVDQTFADVPGIDDFVGVLSVASPYPLAVVSLRQSTDGRRGSQVRIPTLTTLTVAAGRADQE